MSDKNLRQVLEKKRSIKTILTLYEQKRMPSNELAKVIGGSRTTPQERFKEYIKLDLMKKDPVFDEETGRVRVMYSLTKTGEEIARKLSFIFDEEKEVYPITKTIVEDLQDEDLLHAEGVATWEGIIDQAIHEKLLKLKKEYKTKF